MGGPPTVVCQADCYAMGGSWSRSGTILFASADTSLRRVSAAGSDPRWTNRERRSSNSGPTFLPTTGIFSTYLKVVIRRRVGSMWLRSTPERRGNCCRPSQTWNMRSIGS